MSMIQALVALLTAFLLTSLAIPPSPTARFDVRMVRQAEALIERILMNDAVAPCSFLVIVDSPQHSTVAHQVFHSEIQRRAGAAVFKINREGDANSTQLLISEVVTQVRRLRLLFWCVTVVVVSDDPIFLAAFAEASDHGRMLVWETRLLVVTSLVIPSVRSLLQDYWTFSMMNTMFLTPENGSKHTWRAYVHFPYSPAGAQVVSVASLSQSDSLVLEKDHSLFPRKYNNFHGMEVNMTWYPLPPYWIEVPHPTSGGSSKPRFTGRDYIIMENIAELLNFSLGAAEFKGVENWMVPLRTREALVRPLTLPVMSQMLEEFDITYFLERSTLAFVMAKPTLKPTWQSIYLPLEAEVWISVAITTTLVFIVLLVMKHGPNSENPETWLVVKQVVGTLLDESIPGELPHRSTTRVVLAAWIIFAFVVGTVYRSNLTANLTMPNYPPRAENFADLVAFGTKVAVLPEMVMFCKSYEESGSEVLVTIAERMEYVSTHMEGFQRVMTKNTVYLYERSNLELKVAENFTNANGWTPLYVTQATIMSGYCVYILTRSSPFKGNLDYYITAFNEVGLIMKWSTDMMRIMKRDAKKRAEKANVNIQGEPKTGIVAISVVHIQGPLFLYVAGSIVSIMSFVCEVMYSAYQKNRSGVSASSSIHHFSL